MHAHMPLFVAPPSGMAVGAVTATAAAAKPTPPALVPVAALPAALEAAAAASAAGASPAAAAAAARAAGSWTLRPTAWVAQHVSSGAAATAAATAASTVAGAGMLVAARKRRRAGGGVGVLRRGGAAACRLVPTVRRAEGQEDGTAPATAPAGETPGGETSTEKLSETDAIFKEAYEAESERASLLKQQLEAKLAEKLGQDASSLGLKISGGAEEPEEVPGAGGWRGAYEAAKKQTAALEAQLKGDAAPVQTPAAVQSTGPAAAAAKPSTETALEADEIFREAYKAEAERASLLSKQLEATLAEKFGQGSDGLGAKISVGESDVKLPEPGTGGWRVAYEACKKRTAALELQLNKARGIGAPPPPAAAAAPPASAPSGAPSTSTSDASTTSGVSSPPFSTPIKKDTESEIIEKLKRLQTIAEEPEALIRLISVAVLPNRGKIFSIGSPDGDNMVPNDKLMPIDQARGLLGDDFKISDTVQFERCYIFTGSVPQGRASSEALVEMQKRVTASTRNTQVFLQPMQDEGRSMVVMLLDSDTPNEGTAWWQWGIFVVLFFITCLAANTSIFSVVNITGTALSSIAPGATPPPEMIELVAQKCIPTAGGILATVFAQEAARRAVATKYGVELSPPYYLPAWPVPSLGSLGAVTRKLTVSPSKEADYAMSLGAGAAGLVVSLAVIALGFALGPEPDKIVSLNYQLLPLALKFILKPLLGGNALTDQPDPFQDPITLAVAANPVLVGGVVGFILTCFTLLPIGRLDGSILLRQTVGPRAAGIFSLLTFLILSAGAFAPNETGGLYLTYGLAVVVWQSQTDLPPKDSVTDVDDSWKTLGTAMVLLGVIVSVPGWGFPNL